MMPPDVAENKVHCTISGGFPPSPPLNCLFDPTSGALSLAQTHCEKLGVMGSLDWEEMLSLTYDLSLAFFFLQA